MKQVPELHPCLTCGVPVQSGDGPGELAWHSCGWIQDLRKVQPTTGDVATVEEATSRILAIAVERAQTCPPAELARMLTAMAQLRATGEGVKRGKAGKSLLDWFATKGG